MTKPAAAHAFYDVRHVEDRSGHLCVDASAMGRPILERIGFEPICRTVPMRRTSR